MTQTDRGATTPVEELAQAAANGSVDALGELYDRYADTVYRIAYARVGDATEAEDITSDVWLRVHASISSYVTTGAGFPAWLGRIARHRVVDHWRRTGRRREQLTGDMLAMSLVAPGDSPEDAADRAELARVVAAAVETLPLSQREVLLLRFWADMSIAEAAETLGKSAGAVKQLSYRGLRTLSGQLPNGGELRDRNANRDVKTTSRVPGLRTPIAR